MESVYEKKNLDRIEQRLMMVADSFIRLKQGSKNEHYPFDNERKIFVYTRNEISFLELNVIVKICESFDFVKESIIRSDVKNELIISFVKRYGSDDNESRNET